MNWFPTIPGWDGLHPALVMFPVALLLATPLLLLATLFARGAWRPWAGAALVAMALGTAAAWLAVGSGHAAGQLVDKPAGLEAAILRHEALGVDARNLFTLLTLAWTALLLVPAWLKRPLSHGVRIGAHALFLAGYLASTGLVARAADAGGRLVHEHGVQAFVAAAPGKSGGPPAAGQAAEGRTGGSPATVPAPPPGAGK